MSSESRGDSLYFFSYRAENRVRKSTAEFGSRNSIEATADAEGGSYS